MVVVYRVSHLTYFLARRLVKQDHMAMPNILLDERVVPELMQKDANGERMADEALAILEDPGHAARMRERLSHVRAKLGTEGVIGRVAAEMLSVAGTPTAEACDGLDNNCDGTADDGFVDTDADGLADCIDPDDDDDTIPDLADNCPRA